MMHDTIKLENSKFIWSLFQHNINFATGTQKTGVRITHTLCVFKLFILTKFKKLYKKIFKKFNKIYKKT